MIPPYKLFASMKKPTVCFAKGSWVGKYLLFASRLHYATTRQIPSRMKFSAIFKCFRLVKISISALQTVKKVSPGKLDAVQKCTQSRQ